MYRFLFGTLLSLLDEIKISKKQLSKPKLYAIVVGSKSRKKKDLHDASNISNIFTCTNHPFQNDIQSIQSIDVQSLSNFYQETLVPMLKNHLFPSFVAAIKTILDSDNAICDKESIYPPLYTEENGTGKVKINFPDLIAHLVKFLIQRDNKYQEGDALPEKNFVSSFYGKEETSKFEFVSDIQEKKVALEKTIFTNSFHQVFEELFPEAFSLDLSNDNLFKVYIIDVISKQFNAFKLKNYLRDNIGAYIFSRTEIQDFKENGRTASINLDALFQLTARNINRQEAFSQIMMYVFMEAILHAPKIYSAHEWNRKSGQPSKAKCSGIYFLPRNTFKNNENQLVFGTSDVKSNLLQAVDNILSMVEVLVRNHDNITENLHTLIRRGDGLGREIKDSIQSILLPQKNIDPPLIESFGVFFSYSVDVGKIPTNYDTGFQDALKRQIRFEIENALPSIANKIKEKGLDSFSFYFFVLPLSEAENSIAKIMDEIMGVRNNEQS